MTPEDRLGVTGTMGVFDTVEATVVCSECGLEAARKIQFKHAGHRMETYEVGDFVQGVPAGRPLLKTTFTCTGLGPDKDRANRDQVDEEDEPGSSRGQDHRVDCWIHLDRGFLTDVTTTEPDRPSPLEAWMAEKAGWNAQERARALRGIAGLVRKRRETIEGEQAGELPAEAEVEEAEGIDALREFHRIRSEDELLDRLESRLEHAEKREWPRS